MRGVVIGISNIIPGVSGGTMMVSMGIYDKLIYNINNLFKTFKKCFKILLPYLTGMVVGLVAGSVLMNVAFDKIPLPTSMLFIGLIIGSLPMIIKQIRGEKLNAYCAVLFLLSAAVVIVPKLIANQKLVGENIFGGNRELTLDAGHLILYFLLGVIASSSFVIPGISGSMMIMILGYYKPIVMDRLGGTFKEAIPAGDWGQVLENLWVLLPYVIGLIVGIIGVARLIEFVLKKWKLYTYCCILGMVAASPVVILLDKSNWWKTINILTGEEVSSSAVKSMEPEQLTYIPREVTVWIIVGSAAALAVGIIAALKLGGDPEPLKE